jgi:hypothetical protein
MQPERLERACRSVGNREHAGHVLDDRLAPVPSALPASFISVERTGARISQRARAHAERFIADPGAQPAAASQDRDLRAICRTAI